MSMGLYDDATKEREEAGDGGDYLDNGVHDPVRLIEVDTKPTTRNGDPQLFGVWQDEKGRTHKQWIWYDGDRGYKGLWRLLDLINACGVELPGDDDYDPKDHGRLSMTYATKLVGKPHSITLHRPEGNKYREIDRIERTGKTRFNWQGPAQSEIPIDTADFTSGSATQTDDDIPF